MVCPRTYRLLLVVAMLSLAAISGCGTTRWSDTSRTATEQLLLSDAIDRAVSQVDFHALAGQTIYLDTKYISGEVDERYIVSTLRQHMIASGCLIRDKPEEAVYILEIRSGAVGTNRSDLLFGVPATTLPTGGVLTGIPSAIPEIPLVKRTAQLGVCKIAVYAYDRTSGRPVWQSGTRQVASRTKDVWIFGAGPFTRGAIHDGTVLAGEQLANTKKRDAKADSVWVAHEIVFPDPQRFAQPLLPAPLLPGPQGVVPAALYVPVPASAAGPGSAPNGSAPAGSPAPTPAASGASNSGGSSANGGSSSSSSPSGSSSSSGSANGSSTTTGSSSSSTSSAANGTTSSPNLAAGAVGAVDALDWAHTMLSPDRSGSSTSSSTTTQSSASNSPAATTSSLGQIPAALRLKGF